MGTTGSLMNLDEVYSYDMESRSTVQILWLQCGDYQYRKDSIAAILSLEVPYRPMATIWRQKVPYIFCSYDANSLEATCLLFIQTMQDR